MLRFPLLIEHYFEHKQKTPEMTVVEFLALHYKGNHLENHPHDDDYDQDQQLPFMMHGSPISIVCITPNPIPIDISSKVRLNDNHKIIIRDDLFIDRISLSSIWQPPKSC
ncbi:hypothetical protein [Sphingobacterium cavernae]|uniref:hypothetical protein n=1 Tax=Sphingobacterium cavernae TaxID=2592657 RepID=UPI0012301944|nr:hypothetical protein [Sphingobacterium cavernae]